MKAGEIVAVLLGTTPDRVRLGARADWDDDEDDDFYDDESDDESDDEEADEPDDETAWGDDEDDGDDW